jgi:hypothetical protein
LKALPDCGTKLASINHQHAVKKGKLVELSIPVAGTTKPSGVHPSGMIAFAKGSNHRPGVVIDYVSIIGPGLSVPQVFQGDTTYFVKGPVLCNGSTTLEGGAVFKFKYHNTAPTGYAYIQMNSTLVCKTSMYRPAVFTAVDDETVGESMNPSVNPSAPPLSESGYTGDPSQSAHPDRYANPALSFSVMQGISNVRFRYCQEAIHFAGFGAAGVSHAQLVNCIRGIVISGCGSGCCAPSITINNGLFAGVQYPTTLSFASVAANFYHCTVDATPVLVSAPSFGIASFVNCILANVTALTSGSASLSGNYNGFYNSPQFGNNQFVPPGSPPNSPFQPPVGAGNYYLVDGSNFRNVGTTVGVSSALLNDLKQRTTYPPMILNGTVPLTLARLGGFDLLSENFCSLTS